MIASPQISIIMPLHNKESTVDRSIRSVLAQTVSDWELIVVENHSTDDGPNRVKSYDHPNISLMGTDKKGPGAARNVGIQAARGTWIHFLDADDEIDSNYFEILLKAAQENPTSGIIASSWLELQENQPPLIKRPPGWGAGREALMAYSIVFGAWPPHAAILKRSLLTPEFMWDESLDRWLAEDVPFWFKLFHETSVTYAKTDGARYYLAPQGSRSTTGGIERWFQGCHLAAQCSLRFLNDRSLSVTSNQAAYLARQYEDLYGKALKEGRADFLEIAKTEWHHWMQQASPGPYLSISSYWFRKLLGLKISQAILLYLKTLKPC